MFILRFSLIRLKLLSSAVLFFLIFSGFVSRSGEVMHTYYIPHPSLLPYHEYVIPSLEGAMNLAVPGSPSLPWMKIALLLPPGEAASSIEIVLEDEVVLSNSAKVYPQQVPRPLSDPGKASFVIDRHVYSDSKAYPAIHHGKLVTAYMNGHSVAICSFTPFKYIPQAGKLSYFSKVTVKITTKSDPAARDALKNLKTGPGIAARINKIADNPNLQGDYSPVTNSTTDYELLIITPELFLNSFQALIDNYFTRGMRCKITSLASIYNSMSGIDNPQKIRNYIKQEYQNNGIDHVLIAGDAELLPYRGLYCQVQSSSVYTDSNIPGDIYYSSLDSSWNNDGDSNWGEPGEEDLLPDVSVGRLPVSTTAEMAILLNKILSYQNHPVASELNKPFLVGEKLYDNPLTWGGDYMDLLIGYQNENGYATTGIPLTQNIEKLYDRDLPSPWALSTFLAKINTGKSFLNHAGHANTTYAIRMNMSDVTTANFSQCNGTTHNFMPVYTHGCYCGAFDASDCIAEKMLTIDRFANAFIGNSRYGWFNEGSTEGPSEHLNREFVDAVYHEKQAAIGQAHLTSKVMSAPWVTAPGQWEEGALRWCVYCCNVLGDPAMAMWADIPPDLTYTCPSTILTTTPDVQLTVKQGSNPVSGVKFIMIKDTVIVGSAISNSLGQAVIHPSPLPLTTGIARIFTSGYNILPDTLNVNIIPTPVCIAEAGPDTSVCIGNCVTLNGSGNGTHIWSTSDTTLQINVCPVITTKYYLTVVNGTCMWTDSVTVYVLPSPTVNLGPDLLFPSGQTLSLNAGTGFSQYLWSTGAITQGISVGDPGTYWVKVTNAQGCSMYDTIILYSGTAISGALSYNNNQNTGIPDQVVSLYKDNLFIGQTVTGVSGQFAFPPQLPGNYKLTAGCTANWGGINSTDALVILKHFVNLVSLNGLRLLAGDADNSGLVNSIDALMVQKRFTGIIASFPAPDWILPEIVYQANGWGTVNLALQAICRGDANGSYVP